MPPTFDRLTRHFVPVLSVLSIFPLLCFSPGILAEPLPGEGPRLSPRISQEEVTSGALSLDEIRTAGERVFTTPFNRYDGRGDGPVGGDRISPGGRPTIDGVDGYGTVLRLNGLDSQSCNECHVIVSHATVPPLLGIGGVGGIASAAFPKVRGVDVTDQAGNGFAAMEGGRMINPPFLFGSGGVELVGKEMTADLQALAQQARDNPGQVVRLVSKGVDFGFVVSENGFLNTDGVQGIEEDLVVRPFGRKGEFATVRAFDIDALQFHLGMQPVEVVGAGVDADEDGVSDEVSVGELSALHIHNVLLPRPEQERGSRSAQRGGRLFDAIGCAECHKPSLTTHSRLLPVSFPEIATEPEANAYMRLDLRKLVKFKKAGSGIEVPLFADLKRHDMGPGLAESTGGPLDRFFTTARLWGIADTAPYLHDGRATTLSEAILWHGGEAELARLQFADLADDEKGDLLNFLLTLRTPGASDAESKGPGNGRGRGREDG
jgi:hypothetical protein